MRIAVQCRGGEGFAGVLLPGLRQALQRPVVLGSDDLFELRCLVLCDGPLSAGDGLGVQVSVLRPTFFEPLHAGKGDTEPLCDLSSCLSVLQGVAHTFTKIGGERLHDLRIAQGQPLGERLYLGHRQYN